MIIKHRNRVQPECTDRELIFRKEWGTPETWRPSARGGIDLLDWNNELYNEGRELGEGIRLLDRGMQKGLKESL